MDELLKQHFREMSVEYENMIHILPVGDPRTGMLLQHFKEMSRLTNKIIGLLEEMSSRDQIFHISKN